MVAKFMKTNFEEKHVPLKYFHMAGSNFGQRGHLSGTLEKEGSISRQRHGKNTTFLTYNDAFWLSFWQTRVDCHILHL